MTKSTYRFRVTIGQQLLVLTPFFVINTFAVVAYLLVFGIEPIDPTLIIVIAVTFFITVLPVLILHIQYLIWNGNAKLEIDPEKQELRFFKGKNSVVASFNDIAQLNYYATHGHISYKGSSVFYTFDPYRYYKLTLISGKEIIITCLMINDIENTLEQILHLKAERKFRVIPVVY